MKFCWNFVFQISQFFDKISNPYNKITQKFYNCLKTIDMQNRKKDVKNTKKLKKQIVNDRILKIFSN